MTMDKWTASTVSAATQAVTAFITFEEEEGVHRCLREYPPLGFISRLFQSKHKRLHGKRLRFVAAPDPTDILWENLPHGPVNRFLRRWVRNALLPCFLTIITYFGAITFLLYISWSM